MYYVRALADQGCSFMSIDSTYGSVRKILICGLPGAGKTTLAKVVAPKLRAVVFHADEVRANINKDLGFSTKDRIEQARRMSWLCDQVTKAGHFAIADFICPTKEAHAEFGDAFVIWVDRITAGRFADTNSLFVQPEDYNVRVTSGGTPDFWSEIICNELSQRS